MKHNLIIHILILIIYINSIFSKRLRKKEKILDGIYPLKQKDVPIIQKMAIELMGSNMDKSYYSQFENNLSFTYYKNNKLVGFILYFQKNNEFHLAQIAVSKKYQGKGISYELMKYAINNIKKLTNNFVDGKPIYFTLNVKQDNKKAIKLYKKFNFRVKNTLPNYYSSTSKPLSNNLDGYAMIKKDKKL